MVGAAMVLGCGPLSCVVVGAPVPFRALAILCCAAVVWCAFVVGAVEQKSLPCVGIHQCRVLSLRSLSIPSLPVRTVATEKTRRAYTTDNGPQSSPVPTKALPWHTGAWRLNQQPIVTICCNQSLRDHHCRGGAGAAPPAPPLICRRWLPSLQDRDGPQFASSGIFANEVPLSWQAVLGRGRVYQVGYKPTAQLLAGVS